MPVPLPTKMFVTISLVRAATFPRTSGNDTWSVYYYFDRAVVSLPLNAPNTYGTFTNVPGFGYTEPSRPGRNHQ